MQILDGKDHWRRRYERFALDRIVEILNTGRHWGWLDHPDVAKLYSAEGIQSADTHFLTTFRALVDQWINSGIDEAGIETPSERYVRGLPNGYSESLFDTLLAWLGRNMPRPALNNDGTVAILEQQPHPSGLDAETYAREEAIHWLKELLALPFALRLARCSNSQCRRYFARKRQRKAYIKRGVYCGKCKLVGAAERTRLSRQRRKEQQLDAAARAWQRWTKTRAHPRQAEWVAMQVNRQLSNWPSIQAKWVTQNKAEILRRLGSPGSARDPRQD